MSIAKIISTKTVAISKPPFVKPNAALKGVKRCYGCYNGEYLQISRSESRVDSKDNYNHI